MPDMLWNETTKTQYTRPRDRFECDVMGEEWTLVEQCLPPSVERGRPRTPDLREVFNAIQHMLDTGCQWRSTPHCFSPSATIQNYFNARNRNGFIARMMDTLRVCDRELARRSATPTKATINTQTVKTTENGGPAGNNADKKVKGRKRHLVVNVERFPITIAVHETLVQDRDGAPAVILGMLETAPHVTKLWVNDGYQGPKLAAALKDLGIGPVLEIVNNPKEIKQLYRRWIIERIFAWMLRCRRLVKYYERSVEISSAWAQLPACRFMMRRIGKAVPH